MNKCDLIVCDLDNTLYDWVGYFVPSFYSYAQKASELLGCNLDSLLDEFKAVHQKHHDSEHPFALLETRIVQTAFAGKSKKDIAERLDPAFYVFNKERKKTLATYEGVHRTLKKLQSHQIKIVAHTEGKLHAVIDRLRRLDLEQYFSAIYCRERADSEHPNPEAAATFMGSFPLDKITELKKHQVKPDPQVLLEICKREGGTPNKTAYVGDSMARDILMAKRAGVYAIWAKYGTLVDKEQYEKLVRITHWTEADVQREIKLKEEASAIQPDLIVDSFSEIVSKIIA